MEQKKRDGRGGARQGSGPHRRRLFFDAETAKLLAEHMQRLRVNEPELSEEKAVKRLLQAAQTHQEIACTEVLQMVQDALQQHWQSLVETFLSTVGQHLDALPTQVINQVREKIKDERKSYD